MLNTEDRRELAKRHGAEQSGPLAAVLKCAAGLVALIAVAAGPWVLLSPDGAKTAAEPPASGVSRAFPNAMAESKRVFDERRQRYEARARRGTPEPDGLVAGAEAGDPSSK